MSNRQRPSSRKRIEPQIGGIPQKDRESVSSNGSQSFPDEQVGDDHFRDPELTRPDMTKSEAKNYQPRVSPNAPLNPLPVLPVANSMRPFWLVSLFVQGLLIVACGYLYFEKINNDLAVSGLQQQLQQTLDNSASLQAQLSNTGQTLDQKEDAIADRLSGLNERIENAVADIEDFQAALKTIEKGAKTQLSAATKKLSITDAALKKDIQSTQSSLNEGQEKIEQLAGVTTEVDALKDSVLKLKTELDTLNIAMIEKLNWQDSMNVLQASMDSIDLFRQQTNRSLDQLEGQVRAVNQRLRALESPGGS